MIAKPLLQALVPLVDDLSRELPDSERYRRLLEAMQALLPCDAVALLTLDGDWLVPLAVNGLSRDTLGRRFKIDEHPRFTLLLAAGGPLRIAADSPLPDPYDGLVEGVQGQLEVHDCMGCPVQVGEKTWGLLTLDALGKERLSKVDLRDVQALPVWRRPRSAWCSASRAWRCGPRTSASAPTPTARWRQKKPYRPR